MDVYKLLALSLIGSVVSLAGGVVLLTNKKAAAVIAKISGSFAAGALITAVFLDLLPEALGSSSKPTEEVLVWVVVGITAFFFLERRLMWFHHHHEHAGSEKGRTLPSMLIIGDTLHNAIDGVAIAFAFMADPAVGVVTTIAVAFHELPQEIGDFGLLIKAGWSRKKVLLANVISALATVVAAMVVYFIGNDNESLLAPALALTAGMLLYIGLSDVLPSVHERHPSRKWLDSANLFFISGAVIVFLAIKIAHAIEG